jgi:acyl dehydratase
MPIDYARLLNLEIPEVEHSYTTRDTMLYALGIGLGCDPMDVQQLDFVYEKSLKVLPTQAAVLAHPGFWLRDLDTGIDWMKLVHGEQGLVLHKPLQPSGTVVSRSRVVEIIDKGPGRGALVYSERVLFDKASGDKIATVLQNTFCRGDGGFGGPERPQPPVHAIPDRAPDRLCDLPTAPQAALVYRLSGDYNPLHADPAVALAAGFNRPILHGLATFGVAGHAIVQSVCGYRPEIVRSIHARFTAPVHPGETFRTEIWLDGQVVSFQVRSLERNVLAVSNGRAEILPMRVAADPAATCTD